MHIEQNTMWEADESDSEYHSNEKEMVRVRRKKVCREVHSQSIFFKTSSIHSETSKCKIS